MNNNCRILKLKNRVCVFTGISDRQIFFGTVIMLLIAGIYYGFIPVLTPLIIGIALNKHSTECTAFARPVKIFSFPYLRYLRVSKVMCILYPPHH